jgi:hypothetical protein
MGIKKFPWTFMTFGFGELRYVYRFSASAGSGPQVQSQTDRGTQNPVDDLLGDVSAVVARTTRLLREGFSLAILSRSAYNGYLHE